MCILLFQWQPENATPLILASNRDEFYARPTEAARWRDTVFCGLDLRAGGTWLGVSRDGRFAAVTNFREPIQEPAPGTRSRGDLPLRFLQGNSQGRLSAEDYCHEIESQQDSYGAFNLLVGDRYELWYMSNRDAAPQQVAPGIHGLSNGLLDTAWPKVARGKQGFAAALAQGAQEQDLLNVLTDRHQPDDGELPQTGVPDLLEKLVAPIFIESAQYGTRASTLLWLPREGEPRISEHRWH